MLASASASLQGYATAGAVVLAALYYVFEKTGVLKRMGVGRESIADAAGELSIADRAIKRLERERNAERARADQLALERTNEPVLTILSEVSRQLAESARQQALVIDRLATHNGSFAHMEQSLRHIEAGLTTTAEGMKALTSTIAELHDIPMKENP